MLRQTQYTRVRIQNVLCFFPRFHVSICALCFFLLCSTSATILADEALSIAGMGGAFVGLSNATGGIFGNPAGLINVQDNNLSVALAAQNLDYENLPVGEDEQMNTRFSLRLSPFAHYSRTIRSVGVSLGYVDDVDSRNTVRIAATEAGYIVDEGKFVSDTDTVLEYDFLRDRCVALSLGYLIKPDLAVGIKLKYRYRTAKTGTIYRPLRLTAVHGEDVNRNDPAKLLPAVIDNLDIGNAIEEFRTGTGSREDVVTDLSGGGLDFDFGIQAKLFDSGNVFAGFMLEHLIQSRIVKPQPSGIRLGIGAKPTEWIVAAIDFQKALDKSGLNVNLGWEICFEWRRWFSGGIMIRNGFAHESPKGVSASQTRDKLSIGIGLLLGDSCWDYTLVKPLDDSPVSRATHMFSSSVRF